MTRASQQPPRPTVAICVSDPTAAARAHEVLEDLASIPIHITPVGITQLLARPAPWTALIYDLAPWNASVPRLLREIRRAHPSFPILLYPPQRADVSAVLLHCGDVRGVRARHQAHDRNEAASLRNDVRWLLAAVHAERVGHLIQLLLPELPPRALEYIRRVLNRLTEPSQTRPLSVSSLVAEIKIPLRTLQRALEDGGLPSPKALLDWITLLYATLRGAATGRSTAQTARDFGLDAHRIYRIRRRLLPPTVHGLETRGAQDFDLTFLGFADRCRVPRPTASALLERIA